MNRSDKARRTRKTNPLFFRLGVFLLAAALLAPHLQGRAEAAVGDLDPTFGSSGKVITDFGRNDAAFAMAIQADSKILAAGGSRVVGLDGDFALARYELDGNLDASFGGSGKVNTDFFGNDDFVTGMVLDPDGRIIVVGTVLTDRSAIDRDFALARYNSDGSLDASFGVGGKVTTDLFGDTDIATAIALQPDGKIIAVGTTISLSVFTYDFVLVRYNRDGSLDTTFGSGGKVRTNFFGGLDEAFGVSLQSDGKIVVAGTTVISLNDTDFALARYNPDGSLDTSFGLDGKVNTDFLGGYDQASAVAIRANNRIVLAGDALNPMTLVRDFAIAQYNTDGSLDTSFGQGGRVTTDFFGKSDGIGALTILPNGKIIAAGGAEGQGQVFTFALAQYDRDGLLDVSFGSGGKVTTRFNGFDAAAGVATQADGKIVAAGSASGDFAVARYDGENGQVGGGVIYSNFGPGMLFDTNPLNGWTINGFLGSTTGQQAIAHQFTPSASETFTSAQVALTLFGGQANVSIFVQADSNGLPGPILEQINVTGLNGVPTIFEAPSVLRPVLQAGIPYWLAVVANGSGVLAGWNWNSTGDRSTGTNFASTQSGAPAGPWDLNFPGLTRSAFQINGTPVSFDLCLQDDSSGDTFKINSMTGDYQFTRCGGAFVLSGTGSLTKRGSSLTLLHDAADRRVLAKMEGSVHKATASIQIFAKRATFTISDRNTINNSCACP